MSAGLEHLARNNPAIFGSMFARIIDTRVKADRASSAARHGGQALGLEFTRGYEGFEDEVVYAVDGVPVLGRYGVSSDRSQSLQLAADLAA